MSDFKLRPTMTFGNRRCVIFDGAIHPQWQEIASQKGFDIIARIRDRYHLGLRHQACGRDMICKLFTLRTAVRLCPHCLEDRRRELCDAAGVTFLAPGRPHYFRIQLPCGHETERQQEFLERVKTGETEIRCDECLKARLEAEAEARGWRLIGPDFEGDHNYLLYQHDCGQEQRVAIINMRTGRFTCGGCSDAWPFHKMDREIASELLALTWPGCDPAALRELLPPDDQLTATPMLPLMLSLRSDSVEEAAKVLRVSTWKPTPRTFQGEVKAIAAGKGKAAARKQDGIRLADLAGLGAARDTALGIVEDLRAWQAGKLPWDAVHRGMLIAGPPGCGKTELARAMAREPGIHLESASYARWQARGHLGDMLKAMRASFSVAADQAPSVLFLDELDAFGSRTGERSTQHRSYDTKVIAGLLEQLDGIDGREGVVVIGACNHSDGIDPAILRAGRFDQRVEIRRPDAEALAIIPRQHLGDELPDADLAALGQMSLGQSGADCAAAVRAARGVARRAKRPMTAADLRTALVPNHLALPADMRRRAAIHEAGHAIVMTALGVGQVKILRLGPDGGETRLRWHDAASTRELLQRQCAAHLAGRAAEILVLGEASGGAGGTSVSDLHQATMLTMQCEFSYGLGSLGHLSVGAPPPATTLLSLPSAMRQEMQRGLDQALALALEVLRRHRPLLERLARDLETRGFLVEADLAARLAPFSAAQIAGRAERATPQGDVTDLRSDGSAPAGDKRDTSGTAPRP